MKIIKYKQHPEFNRLKSKGIAGILSVIFFWCFSIWFICIALKDNGFFSSIALLVVSFLGLIWVGIFYRLFPRSKWVWKTLLGVLLAYALVVVLFRKPENETGSPYSEGLAKDRTEAAPQGLKAFSALEHFDIFNSSSSSTNRKWGFTDSDGNIVVPPKYDRVTVFRQGMMAVKTDSLWGYINEEGEEVIPPQYQFAGAFSYGMARVISNGKWGYIDITGKIVIPCQFDYIGEFAEGLVNARTNGLYGYIDRTGKTVIPFRYEDADPFENGRATVRLNGELLRIDTSGTPIE